MKLLIVLFLCIIHLHASKANAVTWEIDAYYEDANHTLQINDIIAINFKNILMKIPFSVKDLPTQPIGLKLSYIIPRYPIHCKIFNAGSSTFQNVLLFNLNF